MNLGFLSGSTGYAVAGSVLLGLFAVIGAEYVEIAHLETKLADERLDRATEQDKASAQQARTEKAYREEEQRRDAAQKANSDATQRQLDAARADASDASAAGERLRKRADALAAAAKQAARHSDPVGIVSPVPSAIDMCTDVLGRLDAAGRELAAVADVRGIRGAGCQADYDALTAKPLPIERLP